MGALRSHRCATQPWRRIGPLRAGVLGERDTIDADPFPFAKIARRAGPRPACLPTSCYSKGGGRLTDACAAMVYKMQSRRQLAQLAAALGGIPIWSCLPGSAAARLGVRYGDVILSVNGRPTPNVDAYIAARNVRRDGFSVVVFRDGREHTLEVTLEARAAPLTRAQLARTAEQLAAARLVPNELPGESSPPSESSSA